MEQCQLQTEQGETTRLDKKMLEFVAIGASVGSGCDD